MPAVVETDHEDVNTSDSVDAVGKEPMVMRSLRVPIDLWKAAKDKADAEKKDISQVVRELLERYVGGKR